jgi:HAE1 family hydrophobic/amphiphilic exporter-1
VNLSEIFIRRPIATSLLMAAIALFGVVAYRTLPVSDLPTVDYPTINVNANLPGADPATMASSVATVLERQFTTISGLDEMTSSSSVGNTNITLQFDLDRDIDSAATDVQTAIAEVTPLLPAGMPSPPSFKKQNPTDQAVVNLILTSQTQPMSKLDEYGENLIAQRVSMVNGVAQVNVQGSQKYAVRVQMDPDKLAAKKIGLNEVDAAIQAWNPNLPTGTLYGPDQAYTVTTNAELKNAAAFKTVTVAWRNGAPVHLEDIADVIDGVEEYRQGSWLYTNDSAERAITMQVQRQPGANTIEVTDRVTALLPLFESQLPPSVHLRSRGDRSKQIREGFTDMLMTMGVTLALVVFVIFIFTRNGQATLIPSLALPFSLLGTFAVMAVMNYSLDNLSMMALILSVCFVVDDAIVMLENIIRHIEHGEEPLEAALKGSKEIGFTIISMTVSLAAVFIPVLFLGGILGRLFREFAITITTAILVSGLVSISFTPMLCSRFLKVKKHGEEGWFARVVDWPFQTMLRFYKWSLRGVLHVRPLMILLLVGVLGLTFFLLEKVNKGFIPDGDGDFAQINIEAAQGTSYYQMAEYQRRIADIIRKDPDVEVFMGNAGNSNRSNMFVQLKPRAVRHMTVAQLIEKWRPQVSNFPGVRVFMNIPPALRIGGRNSNSSYQITVQAPDTDELYKQAAVLEREMLTVPQVRDISSDLQMRSPRMMIHLDRERAALYGLDASSIENALYSAYGPKLTSAIYTPANQYRVVLEMKPTYQTYADYLSKIYFKAGNGQLVPLDSLAKVVPDAGPQSINHSGQLPSVTMSFNLKPGVSLGEATDNIREVAKRALPPTVTTSFTGTAKTFEDSMQNLSVLLTVAILVVYIVLGTLYESYLQPLTILSGLPSAGVGALLTLIIFKTDLNIYSFVGLIMLIGIVQKNAIMQVDFALEGERRGLSPIDAVYEGCVIRFRPIMMTTVAAFLGAIPMALGYGAGGEARAPLGLAVAGGLLFSQLMTLYLTPVVYSYLSGFLNKWRSRHKNVLEPEFEAVGYGD